MKVMVPIPAWAQRIFGDKTPSVEAREDVKEPGSVAAEDMADMCQGVRDEKQYGFKEGA